MQGLGQDMMQGVIVVPPRLDVEFPVGGLAPLLRHALALQAAGVEKIAIVGDEREVALPRDPRLRVPVLRSPEAGMAAVVVPGDATCHRLLPARLVNAGIGARQVKRAGPRDERALYVAGAERVAEVVAALASAGRVELRDAEDEPLLIGEFVLPAATPQERERAFSAHLRSLIKPTGGVLDRHLMRPVSLRITRLLARTGVTPNMVSIVSLVLAFVAAGLVATPWYAVQAAGAILFVVMRIVDCVDGELARLRYQGTRFGEWLDTVGDGAGIAAFVAAVTYRLARSDAKWWMIGAIGIVGWTAVQMLQYHALLRAGGSGSFQAVLWGHRVADKTLLERVASAVDAFMRIDAISTFYAAMVIAVQLEVLLWVHVISSIGATFYFGVQTLRRRPDVQPDRAR